MDIMPVVPRLLAVLDRDEVHCHPARCVRCGARCWLGPRQEQFWVEHSEVTVWCADCGPAAGDLMTHLGNPELRVDGSWPAGEVRELKEEGS